MLVAIISPPAWATRLAVSRTLSSTKVGANDLGAFGANGRLATPPSPPVDRQPSPSRRCHGAFLFEVRRSINRTVGNVLAISGSGSSCLREFPEQFGCSCARRSSLSRELGVGPPRRPPAAAAIRGRLSIPGCRPASRLSYPLAVRLGQKEIQLSPDPFNATASVCETPSTACFSVL